MVQLSFYDLRCLIDFLYFLQEGTTPLILAAAGGHADCVRELLLQGADPRARRTVR